ncbi:hypothetical protein [Pseudofulvibacter geojedonensis]|uniref:Lipoprotein n=1 Tax=Pseudofulvibacter geojedonensis TaxID=1123758 RepID=A0ABW3HZQ2_9FLAO
MKKIFSTICVLFLLTSCSKEIKESTLLKEIPESFFSIGNKYNNISISQERLPNTEFSKFYLKNNSDTYSKYFNVTLNFKKGDSITFEGSDIDKNELIPVVLDFIDFAAEGKTTMLHLNFDENKTLKDYIEYKQLVDKMTNESITINPKVFIYDLKALPDCDCSL